MEGHGHPITADPELQLDQIASLHEFIHCTVCPLNNTQQETLVAYAHTTLLTEDVAIPGNANNARTARSRTDTLRLLRQWYNALWVMHRSGCSLAGLFDPSNFLVFRSTMAVRMRGVHLTFFTPRLGNLDYYGFVRSVVQLFAIQGPLPEDIRQWLELINEGVNGNEPLIRYSTALMEPRQAFEFVMTARDILERTRAHPSTSRLYHMLVNMNPQLLNWTMKACTNLLLAKAQFYQDPRPNMQIVLDPTLRGALSLWRNARHHPAKLFAEFMILMIEEDFPGAIQRVQRSFFRAGLLGEFNLPATMG